MDPITAVATMVTAVANTVQTLAEGQPPEVRKQMWEWAVQDLRRFRTFFKLDEKGDDAS